LIDRFDEDFLILDGGLATELERRGCDISGPLWSARVLEANPGAIEQLHYDYYDAGARCSITASYQASHEGFAKIGLDAGRTDALLRRSVELARAARERYLRDRGKRGYRLYVAASVGPYGAILHDGSEYRGDYGLSVGDLVEFHARRFEVLSESGADVLACETLPLLDEARALAALLVRRAEARAWMSFTTKDGIHTSHGEPLRDCARFLDAEPGVVAIGVNCVRPDVVADAIRSLREGSGKPIVVYPNSGEAWDAATERWQGVASDASLAALAPKWMAAGASLIGGCCRVGPDDISAIARTTSGAA
jgi:homocysteine S-methyltransferase